MTKISPTGLQAAGNKIKAGYPASNGNFY